MIRKFVLMAAVIAAFACVTQSAEAGGRRHNDPRLTAVSIGVGAASTAGFFALNDWNWTWDSSRHGVTSAGAWGLTTVGCAALSPIVGTMVVRRPLTYREAHVMIASCVIPFVGGWLVNRAYDNHILWAPDEEPVRVVHERRHRRQAMR